MNQPEEQIDTIRCFIVDEIIKDPSVEITPDSDLLIGGYLDSVSVVRLVAHLEDQYSVKIPPEDILIENFGSIKSISDYISTRL